ncbi:DUF805 domain-containing protein [Moraxella bovis]|uniref:DUF805 domain-containing protein n=1 Tax=Moraxella bovis TaxID=476 RepID=UPI002225E688|nr:DUF805 domain-containing protein [Moraxella bovis]UYZ68946.1 DUF805 domain-containing protein [Moraxella bovis]UYZ71319.1 DUF805 domain-containing protein [Moraxella bovis]UYZ72767.1 DUF805 domain-containing protein [Moraxella bovis]UZA14613.1 DUF805 domain-containing protein [Moraxella bovis]UZA27024.1 DUF805 domain-containing protein [Moraxella bovis]
MEKKSEVPLMIFQAFIGLTLYGLLGVSALIINGKILDVKNMSTFSQIISLFMNLAFIAIIPPLIGSLYPARIRRLMYVPLIITFLFMLSVSVIIFFFNYESLIYEGYKYSLIMWWAINIAIFCACLEVLESRLQDANIDSAVAILFLIPVINLILVITLCFMAGTVGTNQYGEDPRQKGIPKPPTA